MSKNGRNFDFSSTKTIFVIFIIFALLFSVVFMIGMNSNNSILFKTVEIDSGKNNSNDDALYGNFYWGLGPEADLVMESQVMKSNDFKVLTCWINSEQDIETWFSQWVETNYLDNLWEKGYIFHIVTYGWKENHASIEFVEAMDNLSKLISRPDDSKHYVLFSLATEFQTYVEPNNVYNSETSNFYQNLIDYLRQAKNTIHNNAPNSRVSFCWGGWQARYDDPNNGGGKSMFPYFADLMAEMDFMSFQLMNSKGSISGQHDDLQEMINVLKNYNEHLMVAHYKPDGEYTLEKQSAFDADVEKLIDSDYFAEITNQGLFAFSFMDDTYLTSK